jgi:hypothetical protein
VDERNSTAAFSHSSFAAAIDSSLVLYDFKILSNSISKIRVAPPGMFGGEPASLYPQSGSIRNLERSPAFIVATPRLHPSMMPKPIFFFHSN